ncbi:MAG: hypothetical protein B5M48_04235 [Candidatus Omnitrophica bacterium 4484_213]|nr:MAG: hypothetical protein B5M48_04235 [Candidatus Omnitrophica bacterium 4484_213]
MSKLREIKVRIRGIREIEGITNAMKLVAVVRLKRIEKRTLKGRSYTEKLRDLLLRVQRDKFSISKSRSNNTEGFTLLNPRQGGEFAKVNYLTGLIIVTSQSGLCGSFNTRIIQRSEHFLESRSSQLIVLGKKGIHYFKRKGYQIVKEYPQPSREDLDAIVPVRLLPLEDNLEQKGAPKEEFLFEPAREEIIDDLLPECISRQIQQALLESRCAEELERIKAMEYAADNANKLVEELTQQFNRARQTAITREIYG